MLIAKALLKPDPRLSCLGLQLIVGGKIPLMLNISMRENQRDCENTSEKLV